jgi:hypothetical protein
MAKPHPALDAAVAQFAQQPGVSPNEVAQLRAALASDPGLTASLDTAANTGTLHGFGLSAPGAPDRPVGDYAPGSGIVTLPASAFPAPGAPATPDLHATLRVQAMVVEFSGKSFADSTGATHPVTPDMLTNLQDTMNGSPALASELKRAATTPDPQNSQQRILEHFAFTPPGEGVGGSFSAPTHTMNLVSESLATSTPGSPQHYNVHDLTFVIGHEVQHGFNAQAAAQRDAIFVHDVRALAATPGPIHDYTALVEQHIQTNREDEAKAEIAGWNALRSRVDHDSGSVSLSALQKLAPRRANDFIDSPNGTLQPRSNVTLNPDLTMTATPANIAAMGYNYFDRPVLPQPGDNRQAMALGHNGVSDYANRSAGWALQVISIEEQAAVRISVLLEDANNEPMSNKMPSRRQRFETIDRTALRPLPAERYTYAEIKPKIRVDGGYHILFQQHRYSVPHHLVGQHVSARTTHDTVELFHEGKIVACHTRSYDAGGITTEPKHQPDAHRAQAERNPEGLKAWAKGAGPNIARFIQLQFD